jgi:hypothetical protein
VSKANVDLPEPESPVTTIKESLGKVREIFFRLCSLAPLMTISFICEQNHFSFKNIKALLD